MVPLTHSLELFALFVLLLLGLTEKKQLQKLFNEIAKVAEKCLYEASKYGEVSHTWCIVVVVVA